jgi:hypothetical protein
LRDFDGFAISQPIALSTDLLAVARGDLPPRIEMRSWQIADVRKEFRRALLASNVPSPKVAVALAQGTMTTGGTVAKGTKCIVVGLVLIGEDPSWPFSNLEEGDPTWLVRFMNKSDEVVQQAWVNAITGKIDWIFPLEEEKRRTQSNGN